jgi:hypothetical protein
MLPTLLNKRDQNMAPNSIGAFLFKHQREKVKRPTSHDNDFLIVQHDAQRQLLLLKQTSFLTITETVTTKETHFALIRASCHEVFFLIKDILIMTSQKS